MYPDLESMYFVGLSLHGYKSLCQHKIICKFAIVHSCRCHTLHPCKSFDLHGNDTHISKSRGLCIMVLQNKVVTLGILEVFQLFLLPQAFSTN